MNEPGWKAIDHKYLVKFPEDGKYTLKKLTVNKLAGRDPITGNIILVKFACSFNLMLL